MCLSSHRHQSFPKGGIIKINECYNNSENFSTSNNKGTRYWTFGDIGNEFADLNPKNYGPL